MKLESLIELARWAHEHAHIALHWLQRDLPVIVLEALPRAVATLAWTKILQSVPALRLSPPQLEAASTSEPSSATSVAEQPTRASPIVLQLPAASSAGPRALVMAPLPRDRWSDTFGILMAEGLMPGINSASTPTECRYKPETRESFQVQRAEGRFRVAPPPAHPRDIPPFGDWNALAA